MVTGCQEHWLPLSLVLLAGWGCTSHSVPPAPTRNGVASVSPLRPSATAAVPPEAQTSTVSSEEPSADPVCHLNESYPIELATVLDGKVVVSRSLHGVRRLGVPRVTHEPDDHSEYYLAEQRIDPLTLPTRLKRVRNGQVALISHDSICWASLGEISAQAWADEQGVSMNQHPKERIDVLFRDGDVFLAAPIITDSCDLHGVWRAVVAPPTTLRTWDLRELGKPPVEEDVRLVERALLRLAEAPLVDAVNARYERFRRRTGSTFPQHWWQLPPFRPRAGGRSRSHFIASWYLATSKDSEAALLLVDSYAVAEHDEALFASKWFGIYCVTADGSPVLLGPTDHRSGATMWRHKGGFNVIAVPGHAPVILDDGAAFWLKQEQYHELDYGLAPWPLLE